MGTMVASVLSMAVPIAVLVPGADVRHARGVARSRGEDAQQHLLFEGQLPHGAQGVGPPAPRQPRPLARRGGRRQGPGRARRRAGRGRIYGDLARATCACPGLTCPGPGPGLVRTALA